MPLKTCKLRGTCLGVLTLLVQSVCLPADEPSKTTRLYIASYSPRDGEGVFVAQFDGERAHIEAPRPAGRLKSPAALAVHPHKSILYATTAIADASATHSGAIAALRVDPVTGDLREIDRRTTGGSAPCYVSVEGTGRCLVVAHCGSASVACLSLKNDGSFGDVLTVIPHVGESRNTEGKAQAHSVLIAPHNRFAVAADLGLDRLYCYRLEAQTARLTPHDPPFVETTPGAGPRHVAFAPDGRFLYAVNELGNTLAVCRFESDTGQIELLQELSTLPIDYRGESFAAEVQAHPTGRWVYASNRGHDSVAVFAVNVETGRLKFIEQASSGGKFPRHFAIDPAGKFLVVANQKSDRLALLRIDPASGRLTAVGEPVSVPQPVCLKFWIQR